MPARTPLLHSKIRLLAHDQVRVTTAFRSWTTVEHIRNHTTLGPAITTVYRRLQRDSDRLYVLIQSYHSFDDLKETLSKEQSPHSNPVSASPPDCATVFRRAYRNLEGLCTRYESVYTAAAAVVSPPIKNIAYSNQQGIRELMDDLTAAWLLTTIQQKSDGLASLTPKPATDPNISDLPRTKRAPKTALKSNTSRRSPNR